MTTQYLAVEKPSINQELIQIQ